ncbi:hypothetical protein ABZ890_12050 [Streptomyces sp. NPDC046984]|uniref:hypothetical protein n=1 Tax=Streptomyces sp. NPDC046984 TaxID=3155138 RepID=UPI0033D07332
MTPTQVLILAVLAQLTTILALVAIVILALAAYALVERMIEWRDVRRARREDLDACRAINALPPINHPKEPR